MKPGYLSEVFVSFQGEGAHVGRRHVFVRLAGCNMRCRYCDTPDSLERTSAYVIYRSGCRPEHRSNPVVSQDLAQLVRALLEQDAPVDAIALTGGEPLTQADFLADFLERGGFTTPVLLETNGVLPRRLHQVLPWVDIVSMDIKLPSNTGEGGFWDEHAAFLELARSRDLYVKVLVDQTTSAEDLGCAVELLAATLPTVPVYLQPVMATTGGPLIDADSLARFYATARSRLDNVRVLPQTHKLLGIR